MFDPLPQMPDSNALELEVLERWEREGTFEQLREQNRGGPHWSFIDGPVTANKSLAVHTAWGRTLKDVFQRNMSLRGFNLRYQNGFDCQWLCIDVGVERQLGLNSKREIEEFGLEEFARRCRDVVVHSSAELTRGSKRLGQWMDWGNDYFTFSDTNIEYIWRFLKIVHARGWLYVGHRSTEWCPRCGTSLSQHELSQSGVYQEKSDPSLFVRFPLLDRQGESLVVWTTTPWTLPALTPVDEAGRFYDDYGWLHGLSTVEAADQIVGRLGETGFLVAADVYEHRYPHCWRCDTPLIWRISDDWFIGVDGVREQLLQANATVHWVPAYMGKRMDDWLRNMGDWNISRRRYYGLPLPFYPCSCGHLNVVGSKDELR